MLRLFLFFLIAVIVFSVPLRVEAKIEDASAKRDAEKDVRSYNEYKWFAGGCLGAAIPLMLLSVWRFADYHGHGVYIEDYIPHPQGQNTLDFSYTNYCWLSSLVAGALMPTLYAIFHSPTPPAEKFLGKSPDYINAYIIAYTSKVKRQRIALSTVGCIVGTCLGTSTHLLIPESYDIAD